MPHQCVRCKEMFDDGSSAILTGCTSCGGKLFFYIRKEKLEKARENRETTALDLEIQDVEQIEKDVRDMMGEVDSDLPIVLDVESVNVLEPGKFELDLVQLFDKKNPLVYRIEEGRYRIDLANSFRERLLESQEKK